MGTILTNFGQNLPFFQLLSLLKMEKNPKLKNLLGYFFNCPKVHAYQFLGQLKHFPDPWYDFCAKLGYQFFSGTGQKMPFFGQKKANFWDFQTKFLEFIKPTWIYVLTNFGLNWRLFLGQKWLFLADFDPILPYIKVKGFWIFWVQSLRLQA